MPFNASEFHRYYQLKECGLRVYLHERGVPAAEPDAYRQLLERLGIRHEKRHLATLGEYFDAGGNVEATREAVATGERLIYQPAMRVISPRYGEVVGIPDFFVRDRDGYRIRDVKLARRFDERHHPEIFRQLELYGWLYEQSFGHPPMALDAFMGDAVLRTTPYDPARALDVMQEIQRIKAMAEEPFDPIGWSKCLDCGYREYCWSRAEAAHDVALLPGVDQALARALAGDGVWSYDELLTKHTQTSLSELRKQVGARMQRVGQAAAGILQHAQAFVSGQIIRLQPLPITRAPNFAMFDVEGIPPHLEHAEKTYLWGVKVFGDKPSPYVSALAEPVQDGDRRGWEAFLGNCRQLFAEYGDVPLIHWSRYERTQVEKYVAKYGDIDGLAQRVLHNLKDLLRDVVEPSLVLPLPSYSLKLVEGLAGYTRRMPEATGKWAMATYIEAVETEDPGKAAALIDQIVRYNEEDLDATWAVYRWLAEM